MENNFSGAINQLQEMLSSEEGRQNLQNIMGAVAGGNTPHSEVIEAGAEEASSAPAPSGSPDIMSMAKMFMDGIKPDNSPRSNLLTALKPYLSTSRHNHIDNAIKIMSLGNIPGVMKGLGVKRNN